MESITKSTVIVISNDGISVATQELRYVLLKNYLLLLNEENLLPNAILFYGEGVKTVVEDSPFLEALQMLQDKGVNLIVCKTCLTFFGLLDKVKTGTIGTMVDIIHYQWNAEKVITL